MINKGKCLWKNITKHQFIKWRRWTDGLKYFHKNKILISRQFNNLRFSHWTYSWLEKWTDGFWRHEILMLCICRKGRLLKKWLNSKINSMQGKLQLSWLSFKTNFVLQMENFTGYSQYRHWRVKLFYLLVSILLFSAVEAVMKNSNMLVNSAALVSEARKRGCKIIHVPISFSPDYRELSTNSYGWKKMKYV